MVSTKEGRSFLKMILYLSGNFPQLAKIEKEDAMIEWMREHDYDYHRLITFFYKDDCDRVFQNVKTKRKPTFIRRNEK
jgi:hypothetical protein